MKPLNKKQHHTLPRPQRPAGRSEVIARVKSGVHHRGQLAKTWSHFHTWCLPQKKKKKTLLNIKASPPPPLLLPHPVDWIQYLHPHVLYGKRRQLCLFSHLTEVYCVGDTDTVMVKSFYRWVIWSLLTLLFCVVMRAATSN